MKTSISESKTIFISGSRKLSRLNSKVRDKLTYFIGKNFKVLVGDANGADKAVQNFFAEENYKNVVIYHMAGECRNNVMGWEAQAVHSERRKKDFQYFTIKDKKMCMDANYGLMLWDGKSKGTLRNVRNMLQLEKTSYVYFSPKKSFKTVESLSDITELVDKCPSELKNYFRKNIDFSKRNQPQQAQPQQTSLFPAPHRPDQPVSDSTTTS